MGALEHRYQRVLGFVEALRDPTIADSIAEKHEEARKAIIEQSDDELRRAVGSFADALDQADQKIEKLLSDEPNRTNVEQRATAASEKLRHTAENIRAHEQQQKQQDANELAAVSQEIDAEPDEAEREAQQLVETELHDIFRATYEELAKQFEEKKSASSSEQQPSSALAARAHQQVQTATLPDFPISGSLQEQADTIREVRRLRTTQDHYEEVVTTANQLLMKMQKIAESGARGAQQNAQVSSQEALIANGTEQLLTSQLPGLANLSATGNSVFTRGYTSTAAADKAVLEAFNQTQHRAADAYTQLQRIVEGNGPSADKIPAIVRLVRSMRPTDISSLGKQYTQANKQLDQLIAAYDVAEVGVHVLDVAASTAANRVPGGGAVYFAFKHGTRYAIGSEDVGDIVIEAALLKAIPGLDKVLGKAGSTLVGAGKTAGSKLLAKVALAGGSAKEQLKNILKIAADKALDKIEDRLYDKYVPDSIHEGIKDRLRDPRLLASDIKRVSNKKSR